MAPYTKVNWTDEVPAETPVKFSIIDDTDGEIAASAAIAPVTSITSGTDMNALNLGHMDTGIYNAQAAADAAQAAADAAQDTADQATYLYDYRDLAVALSLNRATPLTTSDKEYYCIPAKGPSGVFAGTLISVAGVCIGPSSSGDVVILVKKLVGASWVTMLSANITIEAGEFTSRTATAQPAIGAGNTVTTGDQIEVSVSTQGTGVTYCRAELIFRPNA
jgi:hypothetical protein